MDEERPLVSQATDIRVSLCNQSRNSKYAPLDFSFTLECFAMCPFLMKRFKINIFVSLRFYLPHLLLFIITILPKQI